MDVGPAELMIVLLIALLIFGGTKLPGLARSMGEAAHEFRKGVRGHDDDPADRADPADPAEVAEVAEVAEATESETTESETTETTETTEAGEAALAESENEHTV